MRPVAGGQLHPFVLHFAVALLLGAVGCDVLGLLLRREALLLAGRWNTVFGAGAAALAVLTGLLAAATIEPFAPAGAPLLQLHRALGVVLLAVWAPLAVWRGLAKVALPLRFRTVYLTGAFVGAALVLVQAGLGSAMVYRHGVGLSASARLLPNGNGRAAEQPRAARAQ
jgi:uncharacterized membrane protein